MNKLRLLAIGTMSIFALGFVMGCSKSSDKKVEEAQAEVVEAQEKADAAVAENVAWKDWQSFKADVEAIIAANEKTIAAYKTLMTDASGKMKAAYNKNIDALELKNKALKARLADYKDDGKTSWEVFAQEFKKDLDNLGTALKGFTK